MQNIDWANLTFGYYPTNYNVRCYYRNGQWGELEVTSETSINIHMAATCLHYGQEAFEGMKAFRGKDGKVRIFRMDENGKRLQNSCDGIMMAKLPMEKFEEAIIKVVKLNAEFIPPYETGASLYIRPLLIGMGAQVGVKPASEYLFVVFVTPVGPYFKGGFMANPYVITRKYDGAANFFGIKNDTYITPQSTSILPSITNKSLIQIAESLGMKVERRPIPEEELATFEEAGACGTAAVISPISRIDDPETGKSYTFGNGKPGPWSEKLYNKLRGIQYGTEPDEFGWTTIIEGL